MNKAYLLIVALVFGMIAVIAGCDSGFDSINTDETAVSELDPVPLLNHAIWRTSPHSVFRHTMIFEKAIVQHMITPFGTSLAGGNYNQENFGIEDDTWDNMYENVIRNTVDIISKYGEDPTSGNVVNMARIIRANAGIVLTDTYGDVPFSQAGLAYIEGNGQPVYDTQQAIYNEVLNELELAATTFDPAGRVPNGDILYGGDLVRWKRFANSLMLRAAMRLAKVDPVTAEAWAVKAITGGVLESNADNAMIRHSSNFPNYVGGQLNGSEAANFYMTKDLVDYFKTNGDPRLGAMAVRYVGATSGTGQTEDVATRNPADQIGMPLGYDNNTIAPRAESDGVGSFYGYSQFDRNTIGKQDAPYFLLTYAQTQLLLAEAVVRGWATGDAAETYFANGIRAHMHQLAIHDSRMTIDEGAISTYVDEQVALFTAASGEGKLELINTQYWVASLFNAQEAWANFRRSDYPALTPNPYPQSGIAGDFIRRLHYHRDEYTDNSDNINAAVQRLGADDMDSPVWWDVE